jgi:hypothetical protein
MQVSAVAAGALGLTVAEASRGAPHASAAMVAADVFLRKFLRVSFGLDILNSITD